MKNFEKHLVRNNSDVDAWMRFVIGASWDYIQNKYPLTYPAILIIGGESKECEYVYEADFNNPSQLTGFESFKYHSMCARETIFPGKSIDEVNTIIESLKDTFK